ncbi:HNH endonuclease [Streptomyces mirabilis]|uniref:HNH endonuclease n=1 Tax=Streptomyces mirabilis TaxID=68239 RepID=UPI00331D6B47
MGPWLHMFKQCWIMETPPHPEEGLFMAVSRRKRFEVLRRDSFRCRYCGAGAARVELEVDHVTPVALGGTDDLDNLVTSCAPCNEGKSSTTPDAAVKAALEATAAPAGLGDLELHQLVWGLLSDFTPRQLCEPVDTAAADVVTRKTVAQWFHSWDSTEAMRAGSPTPEQTAEFRRTVRSAIATGYSEPVLYAAASAASWDRVVSIDAHLATVQAGLDFEFARLR